MRLLIVMLIIANVCGCNEKKSAAPDQILVGFQIGVERIEAPASVKAGDPLVVKLYGTIGPNSGYWFDHADELVAADRFELTLFGVRDETPGLETLQYLVELGGREFVKNPPHEGEIRVIVNQPDGSTTETRVAVDSKGVGP